MHPSLRLAFLNVFLGFFGPKMAVIGPKLHFLTVRSTTCESRSRLPLLSFWLNLCLVVLHTHRHHAPKFLPNAKHYDGILIFAHFARAACLLATKLGRSTLDTKKRYKTKTGSTNSVSPTLTLTPTRTLITTTKSMCWVCRFTRLPLLPSSQTCTNLDPKCTTNEVNATVS